MRSQRVLTAFQIAEEIFQVEDMMVEVLIPIFQPPCFCLRFEDPNECIHIVC